MNGGQDTYVLPLLGLVAYVWVIAIAVFFTYALLAYLCGVARSTARRWVGHPRRHEATPQEHHRQR